MSAAVVLLAFLALARSECPTNVESVEDGCSFHKGLVSTSKPMGLVLDEKSCNSSYVKAEWQQQPKVTFADAKSDGKYAVFMIDPDAINTPPGKNYWHWFAANVPGSELQTGDWSKDYSLLSYKGPAPPKGTGKHRYQIILFEYQDMSKEIKVQLDNSKRPKFDLGAFIKSIQDQVVLCGPVSGLQFITEF